MTAASVAVAVVVVAPDGDARRVLLEQAGPLSPHVFAEPGEALACLQDLRVRGHAAVFVLGRDDVHKPSVLMELATRHPDVPVIVATEREAAPSTTNHMVLRRPRSAELRQAIDQACVTAAQRARVRTTLHALNVRLSETPEPDRRQHQRLVLSALYLENILQQAHDAVLITDRRGIVALWNPGAEQLFGLGADAVIGRPLTSAVAGEAGQHLQQLILGLSREAPSQSVEFTYATPMSGVREIETRLSLVSDAQQQGVAVSAIARDVTEPRRLQRQLEQRAQLLADSNRHKDEFLASLSHEMRTPLNVVLGWSHMLAGAVDNPDEVRRGLEMIRRNAELQQRLVDDLLDYARMVAGRLSLQREPVRVSDVVRDTVDSFRPAIADANLTLLESYDCKSVAAVDRDRIRQVMVNLISNAVKFSHRGGQIAVDVAPRGGEIQIRVSDTGDGIAPEFLPFVFEQFSQADPSSKRAIGGVGLGLAIARRLVELHNGRIAVTSDGVGRGATFSVVLPRVRTADEGNGEQLGS